MFGYYLQLGLRSLRSNRWLTALMVLAIAVGIGASMTTLTVMHLLSGDPMPGKSSKLFYVQVDPNPQSNGREPSDVMDYRSAVDLMSAHRAAHQAPIVNSMVKVLAPSTNNPPLVKEMLSTSAGFFPMFDVPFRYGHAWSAADDAAHAQVAVISSALNDRLFGGANSVGRSLLLRGHQVRIIGVLKPWRPTPQFYDVAGGRFAHGNTGVFYGKPESVYTPFQTGLAINDGHFQQFNCWKIPKVAGHLEHAGCVWIGLWVQLDTPAAVASYRHFLQGYADQQKALGRYTQTITRLSSLMQWLSYNDVVPSDVRMQTGLAFAFLAICLFNTVGLLLAKFMRRAGEIGLRRALGATRRDVFAQCVIEAGVIGLVGGVIGLLLTFAGLWAVRRQPVPYAGLAHMDLGMFAFTFLLSTTVALLAGLIPALRASRTVPALQLKTL